MNTGNQDTAIAEAESLLSEHPYRERLWATLMTSLYRHGRQADALAAYRRYSTTMLEELGVDPSIELRDLEFRILDQYADLLLLPEPGRVVAVSSQTVSQGADHPKVPRTERVFGRNEEKQVVLDALVSGRLVSLIGPGGIGKTTLALAIANQRQDDSVFFVDLTNAEDNGDVLRAISSAVLGSDEADLKEVADTLASDDLPVVDNCEQIIDEAASVLNDLLDQRDGVRILATSREPLGIRGERTVRLAGLIVPDEGSVGRHLISKPFLARCSFLRQVR